jgi:uncharacterized protein YegJ (DUF2314 family)
VFNSNQSALGVVEHCWVKAVLFGDGGDFFFGVIANVEVAHIELGFFFGVLVRDFSLNAVVQSNHSVPSGLSSVQNYVECVVYAVF